MSRPRRLLHLHSTFKLGGKEARAVTLMNAFGPDWQHDIVSAEPGETGAMQGVDSHVGARLLTDFPPLAGRFSLTRLRAIGRAIAAGGYDLVLSYNWGAMDGVMANSLFARRPLIHHEDGFNEDEAERQKPQRIIYRRLALLGARKLVVPSQTLEKIARTVWHQPPDRLLWIPNGVDAAALAVPPAPDAIPAFVRQPGEVVVGTLAGLRTVKNLPRLVRVFADACAQAAVPARLVIVGSGPDEARIRDEAARLGMSDRLVMPGFLANPHLYVGLFDIFALSSDSEQFPISLVEAMGAGLPALSTAVGDVGAIVDPGNQPFIIAREDEAGQAAALAQLLRDPALRARLGAANRARVVRLFSKTAMIDRYRTLYCAEADQT